MKMFFMDSPGCLEVMRISGERSQEVLLHGGLDVIM